MSFANINLGTTAGDHSGDPLRVAFDKINRNFYQIATGANGVTIISSVDSVAGRTGNVTLTVADVPGAVTPGQVTAIVLSNLDGYANLDYVNTRLPNVSTINDTISTAIDAEDLPGIRTSIGNLQNQITANDNDILSLQTADTTLTGKITGANAAIITANTAMKAYVDSKDSTLTSAVAAAWATANSAISGSSLDDVIADIAAINANVAGANLDIFWVSNTVNNGLTPSVTNLWANLEAANSAVVTSNTEMRIYVDAVTAAWSANALTQLNQIVGANAAIITANTAMKSYVDVKVGEIADAWLANAVTQSSQLAGANAAIVTANLALKDYVDTITTDLATTSYVDSQDSVIIAAWQANAVTQLSQIAGSNAAIVTANLAMKDYVDAVTTTLASNASSQQSTINTLTANSISQQATLNAHTSNIRDLNDSTIALASAITQINTGSGFVTMPYFTANVIGINSNVDAISTTVAVHSANIDYIMGNLETVDTGIDLLIANMVVLRSNSVTQHGQIISANTYNISRTTAFNDQMSANIIAANLAISNVEATVDNLAIDVTNLESTVTGLLVGGIYSYSNSNVASYLPVNSTITSIQGNIVAANAAIVTANTALKNYVDTQVASNAYSNVKVADYLLTSTGNINAGYITADAQVMATSMFATDIGVTGQSELTTVVTPVVSLGATSGSISIDVSIGDCQTLVTDGAITVSGFTNWPGSGTKGSVTIQILVTNAAHSITFPSSVSGLLGVTGLHAPTLTWNAPVTGTYIFTFSSVDNGSTVHVTESNSLLKPFNSTAESITNTGNAIVSMGTTFSTYRTASNGTAYLGNGVAGQIKIISSAVADTWVVACSNTLWPSSRITFSGVGQAATVIWNSASSQWNIMNVFGSPSFA